LRLPLGCAITAAVLGFIASSGCLARPPRPAALPSSVARASVPPPATPVPAPVAEEPGLDLGGFAGVLDTPALADVRTAFYLADYAAAVRALEKALAGAPPDGEELARWRYQLGKLRGLAGDFTGAAEAFDLSASFAGPLAGYAHYGAAQALIRLGRLDEGIVQARAVEESLPIRRAAELLVAEALDAKSSYEEPIDIYRGYLAESRHPARWVEIALKLAQDILAAQPDGDQAERAALLCRRVMVEAPTSSLISHALDLERQALALVPETRRLRRVVAHGKDGGVLPSDWAKALSPGDQLTRAGALSDAQRYQDADKALDALAAAISPKGAMAEIACRTDVLHGAVLTKMKERARAEDVYGLAISRCEEFPDASVEALYFGAKASASAGHCDEALLRFERVEHDFSNHRFADDARLRGAECALELGDAERYEKMLSTIADDYPRGDMAAEGLFRLSLYRMSRGKWAEALEPLRRAQKVEVPDSPPGRLAYFRARCLQALGDTAAAKEGFASVVREDPLSYYMLHAYSRLSEIDAEEARTALERAIQREPAGRFTIKDDEVFHSGPFLRAVELLKQGESDFARREIGRLGVLKDDARPEVVWAAAMLYAKAGILQMSHYLPKARLSDWLAHYPVGRWREAWEIAYPRPYAEVVDREAKKSGIPAALAYAVMREESAFDAEAVSPAHAYGLMQLILPTARHAAKDVGISCDEASLYQPEVNVKLGCHFLGDLRARFPQNPHLAISAYNAGPGAPMKWAQNRASDDFDIWVEQIPYEETRKYQKRVMTSYAAYLFLYDRAAFDAGLRLPKAVMQ
jgi:peptidoglycan lytic transglycosylase